jgi:hypothetical protein
MLEKDVSKTVDKDNFLGCNIAGPSYDPDLLYEMRMGKQQLNQDSAKQIGFWILNCSKMILLRFIHLQMQYYLRPGSWEIYATDTDSCIIGAATKGSDLRPLCKPELAQEFDREYAKIFVTKEEDSLKPLLMKVEKQGDVFVGLASKTYHLASNSSGSKIASKGISQGWENRQVLEIYNYLAAAFDVDTDMYKATIRGMRVDSDKQMRTYVQRKKGLHRLCPKVGYFLCAICNFPRELKDDLDTIKKLYPFCDRKCEIEFESIIAYIKENFPNLLK